MAKNKEIDREREELFNLRKQLRDREKKIISRCNHRKGNGKLSLNVLQDGRFECKKCGEVFSMDQIKRRDIENALQVIHDMVNQTRCLTNPDKQSDVRISQELGVLNFDVKEAAELYERVVRKKGNNRDDRRGRDDRRNNDDRNDGFGSYGALSLGKGKGNKDKGGKKKHSYYY